MSFWWSAIPALTISVDEEMYAKPVRTIFFSKHKNQSISSSCKSSGESPWALQTCELLQALSFSN